MNRTVKVWRRLKAIAGLAALAIALCAEDGRGREWSEEIQMTDEQGVYLSGTYMRLKVDSRDVLHIIYRYGHYQAEGTNPWQAVYQQFNKFGEAITVPMVIGEVTSWPEEWPRDSVMRAYDICLDRNENVYVLWGNEFQKNVTKFSPEGEVIDTLIALRGFGRGYFESAFIVIPQISVMSDGKIILYGDMNPDPDNRGEMGRVFIRFNPEGAMLDSVVTIHSWILNGPEVDLDPEDNLHEAGNHSLDFQTDVWYSRVTPENEFLFRNYEIPGLNGHDNSSFGAFGVDSLGRPVMTMYDSQNIYVTRYNAQMDREYATLIGYFWNWSHFDDLFIEADGKIHVTATFQEGRDSLFYIGYASVNPDGSIADSVQWIHDYTVRGGQRRNAHWNQSLCFACSDGTVGVIWNDSRYYNYRDFEGDQLFMRYSEPPQNVKQPSPIKPPTNLLSILSVEPNPFNASTLITMSIAKPGSYTLSLLNGTGQFIGSDLLEAPSSGLYRYTIQSRSAFGRSLPSGKYFFQISGNNLSATKQVVIIR